MLKTQGLNLYSNLKVLQTVTAHYFFIHSHTNIQADDCHAKCQPGEAEEQKPVLNWCSAGE